MATDFLTKPHHPKAAAASAVAEENLSQHQSQRFLFVAILLLGLLTCVGYTIVYAIAQDLAVLFDKVDLMPMFGAVLIAATLFMTVANSR